jgi:ribosome-associated protein
MPEGDLPVGGPLVLPAHELHWRFSRSSGPGGQGVNTADSRVELSFDLARSLHGLAEPVPWICAAHLALS